MTFECTRVPSRKFVVFTLAFRSLGKLELSYVPVCELVFLPTSRLLGQVILMVRAFLSPAKLAKLIKLVGLLD